MTSQTKCNQQAELAAVV